ncbi:MAG: tRNA pseudouridine(38-40) synthase TruA [Lachnospiraceae bacterium]|nr:tRNA pseudouridine(38-40) synthase TruA [Lachnospiraceae bacterium]
MKRVKLIVAYDGTNYCGWQVQPNGVSVSSVLNRHLSELLGEDIYVLGASRTDAGVHARGNVAVFDTSARMPAERISYALNTRLPADIRIQDSREVAPDFHPRFRKTRKTYEYKICYRRFPDPINRLYSLFYHWDLDVEKMRRAASYLVGTHDFTSFCTNKPEVKNRVRTIYSLDVLFEPDPTAFTAEKPHCGREAQNDASLAEKARSAAGIMPCRAACDDEGDASIQPQWNFLLPDGENPSENCEFLPTGESQPENVGFLPTGESQPENVGFLAKGETQ